MVQAVPQSPSLVDSLSGSRELPHNLELEQALLGAILINNEAMNRVSFLKRDHFFEPLHGRIYETAEKLIERGQLAIPETIRSYLEADAALQEVGGPAYLARLVASATTIVHSEDYGRALLDLANRRQLIEIGELTSSSAYDVTTEATSDDLIAETEQMLFNLAEHGDAQGGFIPFTRSLSAAVENIEYALKREGKLSGVGTGLDALDDLLGGLHNSDLIILAGRPSMGKTALATNIAFNAARAWQRAKEASDDLETSGGAMVGFFSLEMSADQLATRMLSEQADITSEKLRRGQLSKDEFLKVARASQEIESLPFFIDDTPALTISSLLSRARRLKRQHGLSLIVVDYLQLVRPSGRRNYDNRVQEISEITQGLKALAKSLNVPVLALSQLSRSVEQREDKRPLLSDLRESGSIEQDADVVMFVYREEYYHERKKPEDGTPELDKWIERAEHIHGLAEVIIGKQRHGPTGVARLHFNRETTKFSNLVASSHLPDATF